MLYDILLNKKKLYGSPIIALFAKISYDSIFYGNMSLTPFLTGIMCYFGTIKITEVILDIFNVTNNTQICIKDKITNETKSNSAEAEYTHIDNKQPSEPVDEIDLEEIIHDAATMVKKSQSLIDGDDK